MPVIHPGASPAVQRRSQLAELSAQIQRGALEEARQGLRNLLDRDPGDGDALHLMGLLCKQAKDFQGALDYMRRSLGALPDRADFHGNLGNLHYGLGQYREAEVAYRAALARDRDFRAARIGLARLLTRTARPRDGEAEARGPPPGTPATRKPGSSWAMPSPSRDGTPRRRRRTRGPCNCGRATG